MIDDDGLGLGAQPRCPDDDVLMRADGDAGWVCPACGSKLPAPPVRYPSDDGTVELRSPRSGV